MVTVTYIDINGTPQKYIGKMEEMMFLEGAITSATATSFSFLKSYQHNGKQYSAGDYTFQPLKPGNKVYIV